MSVEYAEQARAPYRNGISSLPIVGPDRVGPLTRWTTPALGAVSPAAAVAREGAPSAQTVKEMVPGMAALRGPPNWLTSPDGGFPRIRPTRGHTRDDDERDRRARA
jgi:hypothetical protein